MGVRISLPVLNKFEVQRRYWWLTRPKPNIMQKIGIYFRDSYKELMEKVSWPTWAQLQQSTMIVLVATLLITAFISLVDFAAGGAMKFIYKFF